MKFDRCFDALGVDVKAPGHQRVSNPGALQAGEGRHVSDELAATVGLDMADWWAATGASYLSHVPKARLVGAVAEAVSGEAASALASLKKAEAVQQAEQLLAGRHST